MNVQVWGLVLLFGAVVLCEPVLANRFETIGGGVSGSYSDKREFLQISLLILSGVFLFTAILAVVMPHSNAAFLNYRNWKSSAIVLAVLGGLCLIGYLLV